MTEQSKMPELSDDMLEPLLSTAFYGDRGNHSGLRAQIVEAVLSIQAEVWNAAIEAAAQMSDGPGIWYVVAAAIRTLRKETENHG